MSQRSSVARAMTVSSMALALAMGVSACGSDDKPSTSGPSSSSPTPTPTTTSPSPSATASPTPSAPALSRFEDDPAVQAARAWAVAYSTDINNQDQAATELTKAMTANPPDSPQSYEKTDLSQKGYDPGPLPFTPTSVKRSGSSANVFACMQFDGWAVNRKTKQPIDSKRTIEGVRLNVKQVGGQWKVALLHGNDTVRCDGVTVKGLPW